MGLAARWQSGDRAEQLLNWLMRDEGIDLFILETKRSAGPRSVFHDT